MSDRSLNVSFLSSSLTSPPFSKARSGEKSKSGTFMNCDVVGLVALDEILGLRFRGVMDVAFESHVGNDFLHDDAPNSTGLRIPFNVITALERLHHRS